jgi:hypothetical protein
MHICVLCVIPSFRGALCRKPRVTQKVTLPPRSPTMTKPASTRRRRPSLELVDAKQAVDLATAQSYSENVFLFVPNLIGK